MVGRSIRTSRSSGGKVRRDGELSADRPQLVWIRFFWDGESPVSWESVEFSEGCLFLAK